MGLAGRLARSTPVRLALFAVLALILVWTSLGHAGSVNEFRDGQLLLSYERVAVDTVVRFGELPMWNPYYCGGLDGVGAPQSRFTSPTLLLSLLFGPERAEVPLVFLFAVLGMEGMYRWLRLRVQSAVAALLTAPVFALSGHFAVAFLRGWTNFFGFELVPWILLGVTLAARGRVRGVAIASVSFAVLLGFGGTFAAPLVAIAAIVEGIRAVTERPPSARGRALAGLVTAASFMATVAFVRLWPVAETLAASPRIMAGTPGNRLGAMLAALTATLLPKDGDVGLAGSFFVGSAFCAIVALGVSDRRARRGVLAAAVFVWLAGGYALKPALFAGLRELPVFSALRYPERFLWLAILFASEPAARALAYVPHLAEGRWRIGASIVLSATMAWTVVGEVSAFHRASASRDLGAPPREAAGGPSPGFRQSRGNRWLAAHYEAEGLGSLSCWETHPVAVSSLLRGDLPAEEYLSEEARDAGTVKRVSWSPNRIVLRASVSRPARILVNQNWHPGWRASVGTVLSKDGLIAIDVPAGDRDIELRFRPWSTIAGAGVTVASLAMLATLAWRARRRGELFSPAARTGTLACIVLPWAVAASAHALSPDRPFPPPTLRNANGTPAIVDVATEKQVPATHVGATFDLPIRLEAASVRGPDELDNLVVDVYLRRTGTIPRATTMFVHVERREEQASPPKTRTTFYNADHQVQAGTFYLSDAPSGRLVHDAHGVHLTEPARGVWDVYIAFGHVSGRQGRAKVIEPGSASVSADRVRVGTFVVQ